MDTNTDAYEADAKYDRIRDILHSHCTEDEFQRLACPQCVAK